MSVNGSITTCSICLGNPVCGGIWRKAQPRVGSLNLPRHEAFCRTTGCGAPLDDIEGSAANEQGNDDEERADRQRALGRQLEEPGNAKGEAVWISFHDAHGRLTVDQSGPGRGSELTSCIIVF